MPLFNKKFTPKKAPSRKSLSSNAYNDNLEELVFNQRSVLLKLGDQELLFENGQWIPENGKGGQTHKYNQSLKQQNQELREENNMLKLKYSVMLNMLTQTTAENQLQEKQLAQLRKK